MKRILLIFTLLVSLLSCDGQVPAIGGMMPIILNADQSQYEIVEFGYYYNWYAITDSRNIAPDGWSIPTYNQYLTLVTDIGGYAQGGKLMDTNEAYWTNLTYPTNTLLFNGRGNGYVTTASATPSSFKDYGTFTTSDYTTGGTTFRTKLLRSNNGWLANIDLPFSNAVGIRLMKNSTTLSNGESGLMTGNDGKVYRTICIAGKEYTADNIKETKFRNGDDIPFEEITSWSSASTPMYTKLLSE